MSGNSNNNDDDDDENNNTKKRPRCRSNSDTATDDVAADDVAAGDDVELCSFCQARPAVVRVPLPSLKKRNRRLPTAFCLLHYYTTSAVRIVGVAAVEHNGGGLSKTAAAAVTTATNEPSTTCCTLVINHPALEEQLPAQQELFAEAFVQLRQELQEATMQQFTAHPDDPLAILHKLHGTTTTQASKQMRGLKAPPKKKLQQQQQQQRNETMDRAGGFLSRQRPLPDRLQKVQQQQRRQQQQQELLAQQQRTRQKRRVAPDTTMRRQPTRKSIWNVMLDDDDRDNNNNVIDNKRQQPTPANVPTSHDKVCTCGSAHVRALASNTSHRNQDMAKAETWGNKDRGGEIISRYQCSDCAKTWNEEE